MRTKWRIYRSQEVAEYLIGLQEYGRGIRQVIDHLAKNGIPDTADKDETEEPITYTWIAADHIITCILSEEEQAIYVSEIIPTDIDPDEVDVT